MTTPEAAASTRGIRGRPGFEEVLRTRILIAAKVLVALFKPAV